MADRARDIVALTRRTFIGSGIGSGAALTLSHGAAARTLGPTVKPPTPWGATPNRQQLAWHQREMYAFVHFTINTFTGKEWGYGDESPALFNPTDFDADQIVAAAKSANLLGLILTAKHHDGFCLWPSRYTQHSIRNSPYRNGKGDMVREMADACRRGGIDFGLYLSPWDRNHAEYGRPAYVQYFKDQLVELCSNYGPLFELWFDMANGGDGHYGGTRETRQIDGETYYDWPDVYRIVRRLQPTACTFNPTGSDLRWVGNERGVANDPCWPTMPDGLYTDELGMSGQRGGELWWPAEADVSIRPGWFYHPEEDGAVKTPTDLVNLYDQSVGLGTTFLLNLAPDQRGQVPDPDLASLQAFGDAIRGSFATDLARGAVVQASAERGPAFRAANVTDGDRASYWSTADNELTPWLILHLPPGQAFDLIRLRERLDLGIRVTRFAVDMDRGNGWEEIAERQAIGAQRILRLPHPVVARRLRLRIVEATACPAIAEFALFRSVAPRSWSPGGGATATVLDPAGWTIAAESAAGARALLHAEGGQWVSPSPASCVIAFGTAEEFEGFVLTSLAKDPAGAAPPARYRLEGSPDGVTWRTLSRGELSNIANARQPISVRFPATGASYVRFTFPAATTAGAAIAIGAIQLLKAGG